MTRSTAACVLAALLAAPTVAEPVAPGVVPEDFALRSLDGSNHRLSEHRGEVVVLVFWASWCSACRAELERLEQLLATYRSAGLAVYGINLDEDAAPARAMAGAARITFPTLLDATKQVSRRFDPATLPTTVLIDRGGTVRAVRGEPDARAARELTAAVRLLLDE